MRLYDQKDLNIAAQVIKGLGPMDRDQLAEFIVCVAIESGVSTFRLIKHAEIIRDRVRGMGVDHDRI